MSARPAPGECCHKQVVYLDNSRRYPNQPNNYLSGLTPLINRKRGLHIKCVCVYMYVCVSVYIFKIFIRFFKITNCTKMGGLSRLHQWDSLQTRRPCASPLKIFTQSFLHRTQPMTRGLERGFRSFLSAVARRFQLASSSLGPRTRRCRQKGDT